MTEIIGRGIAVDECIACGAFWFDGGEFEDYISEKTIKNNDNKKIALLSHLVSIESDIEEYCPKCNERLINGKIGKLSLSKCPQCNGVFIEKEHITAGHGHACEPLAQALIIELVGSAIIELIDEL